MEIDFKAIKIKHKPFKIKFYTKSGKEVVFKNIKNMQKLIKKGFTNG